MKREDIVLEVYEIGRTWVWGAKVKNMFTIKQLPGCRYKSEKEASAAANIAIEHLLSVTNKRLNSIP